MRSIIEELYYGNIVPTDREVVRAVRMRIRCIRSQGKSVSDACEITEPKMN